MKHVMIDMETLGTYKDAAILTIGAIKFDPTHDDRDKIVNGEIQLPTFYRRIDLDSCTDLGLRIDEATIEWWGKQGDSVLLEAFAEDDRHPIDQVMIDLYRFCQTSRFPWSNGAAFDCAMLEVIYEKLGRRQPWQYWDVRDCRTLYDLGGVRLKDVTADLGLDQAHHALYDSFCQVIAAQEAYRNLNLT